MNPLESRIYSDAAAAAAEITPETVPVFRPPAAPGRPPRRPGARRWLGTRRWLVPLAAASSVAAISIAAVAVAGTWHAAGRAAHREVPGGHRGASATAHPSGPAASALAAEALDWYFPASGAQYTAGLAFEWTQIKITRQIFGSCMARAGYPQPPFTTPERSYLRAFPDNSQFPDLAQLASMGTVLGPMSKFPTTVKPKSAAGKAALAACTAASGRPFTPIGKIAGPLQNKWMDIITRIQTSAAARATQPAFGACLQAHGVPGRYARQREPAASDPLFAGFFGWMDHLGQTATSSAQQAREEHRWTPVFVTCARPAVTVIERLQATRRAGFFGAHTRQIAEIRALAAGLPGGTG